jgi:thermitase
MKRLTLQLAAMLGVLVLSTSGFAAQYLVQYKNKATLNALRSESANLNMQILSRHAPGKYVVVDIEDSQIPMTLYRLFSNPNIAWVVPNFKLKAFTAPQEHSMVTLRPQWAVEKIKANEAWSKAGNKGKKNVLLAVIDTGVDYNHKNLVPNMVAGYDFRDNDADPMDLTSAQNPGHGTHCAGIAAGAGNVEEGIIGSGPDVSIMPIRFLGADGSGDLNGGIRSIDYAIEKGAHVISASWGAAVPRNQAGPLIEAVQRADAKGVIFVAAAANDGKNNDTRDMFPANANTPNMISVAASNSSDGKPQWSNYGKAMVHLASPGEKIMSTLPNNGYGELSGTSMATPLVSGLVAFLKSQDSSLTGAQIRALLQTTGAKVNIETACNCRIDAAAATEHLIAKKKWLVPAAATMPAGASTQLSLMNAEGAVKYASSNAASVAVDDSGNVRFVADGSATITATDASGQAVTSLEFFVGKAPSNDPGDGNPPGGGDCPLGDPAMCEILCGIMPDAPFCN